MLDDAAPRLDETTAKKSAAASTRWARDAPGAQRSSASCSQPTVNIEGLVGGYTGPGGKTMLPHRAVAKLDLRLVPDMTATDAVAALKAHLAKRGFGDIEVNMTGGYDPTSTRRERAADPGASGAVYKRARHRPDALAAHRRLLAGLRLHRRAAQARPPATSASATAAAPTRPTSISSSSRPTRRCMGWDGAVRSFVDYLHELAVVVLSRIRGMPDPADAVESGISGIPGPASGISEELSGILLSICRLMAPVSGRICFKYRVLKPVCGLPAPFRGGI